MNYGEMQALIQGRCQDNSTSTLTQIMMFINQTQRELVTAASMYIPALEASTTITTTALQASYNLPVDFERMYDVLQKDTPAKMTFQTNDQFDNLKPDPTGANNATGGTGNPLFYTIWGQDASGFRKISFYPIPDAGFNSQTVYIRYMKKTTDMSSDSDVPVIPDRWHHLIVQGAYAKVCEYNEETVTGLAYGEYYRGMTKFIQDMEREVLDAAPAMRIMAFDCWAPLDTQDNPLNQ